jgi:hypothetical protein
METKQPHFWPTMAALTLKPDRNAIDAGTVKVHMVIALDDPKAASAWFHRLLTAEKTPQRKTPPPVLFQTGKLRTAASF